MASIAQEQDHLPASTPLNITALSSRGGYSVIECWQLNTEAVYARSALNWAVGGNATQAELSIIEPRTTVGQAWAGEVQYARLLSLPREPGNLGRVYGNGLKSKHNADMSVRLTGVLNGLIRVTAPFTPPGGNSTVETHVAHFMPGTVSSSFLIAADLASISTAAGHYTEFPSNEQTVLVQVPFLNNEVPAHSVLHDGACT